MIYHFFFLFLHFEYLQILIITRWFTIILLDEIFTNIWRYLYKIQDFFVSLFILVKAHCLFAWYVGSEPVDEELVHTLSLLQWYSVSLRSPFFPTVL